MEKKFYVYRLTINGKCLYVSPNQLPETPKDLFMEYSWKGEDEPAIREKALHDWMAKYNIESLAIVRMK